MRLVANTSEHDKTAESWRGDGGMKTDPASPKQRIWAEKTTCNGKRGKMSSLKTNRKSGPPTFAA